MDVINRLRSAVTNVLPVGNPITIDYEILGQKASGGPGMLWKIYDAIDKSNKQEVSIFLLEKKLLDRFSKSISEYIIDYFKKGVLQLTKLRHPKILSVVHPLEDSRESLAFATEPIFSSLANVLGFHDNLPVPPPGHLKNFDFFDLEIRYGLLQVIEALVFLHGSARIVHGNCCPEAIYINKYGCWKLAGFDFCILASKTEGNPYYSMKEYDTRLDPSLQAKLNYLAPEFGLGGYCDTLSDMYSVAILLVALYNKGRTIYDCMGDYQLYKKNVAELRNLKSSQIEMIPESMKGTIKLLLNVEPTVRPDALQFSKLPYFEDVGVMTLTYLDLLVQKDNLQKSQFFKSLPQIITKLPLRVNLQRVVPSLAKECSVPNMVPFILPTIFEVAKQAPKDDYNRYIFPTLIPLFKLTEPIQVMLIFLQNMSIILNKTPQNDIGNHVLPMISRALDADMPQLRDLCLNIIPTFAGLVEQASLKNSILPKILKIYTMQVPLGTRVNSLVCLGQLLEYLDKWYVLDDVLPILQSIPCKEPAILMSILGIFKIALNHKKLGITKEIIANKIVPFLFPYCIENSLNLSQFNTFMSVMNDMISRVEIEQRKKLEQLDQVQQENKTLQKLAQESSQMNISESSLKSDSEMYDFFKTIGFNSGSGDKNLPMDDPSAVKKFTNPADLTIEEKTSLALQQELIHRMKIEQLNPTFKIEQLKPTQQTKIEHSKDLTASLIDNNLSNLSLKMKPQSMNLNQVNYSSQNYSCPTTNYNRDLNSYQAPVSKQLDLSVFDNLNVINKPANFSSMPMNQLIKTNINSNINIGNHPNNVMPSSFSMPNPYNSFNMSNSFNSQTYGNQNSEKCSDNIQNKPNPFKQTYTSMNSQASMQLNLSNAKPKSDFNTNKDLDDLLG